MPGSSRNQLSFSASPRIIRQSLNSLPFSNGTVLLCSGRLCSIGTAFPSKENIQPSPRHVEGVFPITCQEFFLLFIFIVFLPSAEILLRITLAKQSSEPSWVSFPCAASTNLLLHCGLPRAGLGTCFSVW